MSKKVTDRRQPMPEIGDNQEYKPVQGPDGLRIGCQTGRHVPALGPIVFTSIVVGVPIHKLIVLRFDAQGCHVHTDARVNDAGVPSDEPITITVTDGQTPLDAMLSYFLNPPKFCELLKQGGVPNIAAHIAHAPAGLSRAADQITRMAVADGNRTGLRRTA